MILNEQYYFTNIKGRSNNQTQDKIKKYEYQLVHNETGSYLDMTRQIIFSQSSILFLFSYRQGVPV